MLTLRERLRDSAGIRKRWSLLDKDMRDMVLDLDQLYDAGVIDERVYAGLLIENMRMHSADNNAARSQITRRFEEGMEF